MCVVVSNREKPMNTAASSFTARNNAKRAAEKMIANGKAPAVDYGIRPRDDGRFEIVWKTVPTTGEVETEIAVRQHLRARAREATSSASIWTGTRVPRNTGFPPMILPINRSLVGARVERISSARAPEICPF
jgi:hypothetical protein